MATVETLLSSLRQAPRAALLLEHNMLSSWDMRLIGMLNTWKACLLFTPRRPCTHLCVRDSEHSLQHFGKNVKISHSVLLRLLLFQTKTQWSYYHRMASREEVARRALHVAQPRSSLDTKRLREIRIGSMALRPLPEHALLECIGVTTWSTPEDSTPRQH